MCCSAWLYGPSAHSDTTFKSKPKLHSPQMVVPGASPDDYGWEIGPGIHEGRPPVAVLRPAERDEWPVQIRRAGVTRKSPVIFRDAVDRMVFAIDFGL